MDVNGDSDQTLDTYLTRDNTSEYALEPRHEISNSVICATSKASVQPAHTRSLVRALSGRLNIL